MPAHMPSLLDIVTHTPVWAWGLFALLLFLGYQRTRDRVVSVWRLLLMPLVLGVLALGGLMEAGLSVLPAAAVGLVIGGVAGWLLERDGATRRVADGKLWLRGEWWSLLQIVLIIGFRYTIAVTAAVAPLLATNPSWRLGTTLVSTALTTMLVARTAARLRVYFASRPATA